MTDTSKHEKTDALQFAAAIGQSSSTDLMMLCRKFEEDRNSLLTALELAVKTAEFEKHPFRPWIAEARAAISKAKGE